MAVPTFDPVSFGLSAEQAWTEILPIPDGGFTVNYTETGGNTWVQENVSPSVGPLFLPGTPEYLDTVLVGTEYRGAYARETYGTRLSVSYVAVKGQDVPDGNVPPVARDDKAWGLVGQPITIPIADLLLNDDDPNGDPVSFVNAGSSPNGTVTFSESSVFFTPARGFKGRTSFSYTIQDSYGAIDTAEVSIWVGRRYVTLHVDFNHNATWQDRDRTTILPRFDYVRLLGTSRAEVTGDPEMLSWVREVWVRPKWIARLNSNLHATGAAIQWTVDGDLVDAMDPTATGWNVSYDAGEGVLELINPITTRGYSSTWGGAVLEAEANATNMHLKLVNIEHHLIVTILFWDGQVKSFDYQVRKSPPRLDPFGFVSRPFPPKKVPF